MDFNYSPDELVTDRGAFLIPYMPRDFLMAVPWFSCLSWALRTKDIMDDFRTETGCLWTPATSPIDQMIDQATHAERTVLVQFVAWFNANVWGDLDLTSGIDADA